MMRNEQPRDELGRFATKPRPAAPLIILSGTTAGARWASFWAPVPGTTALAVAASFGDLGDTLVVKQWCPDELVDVVIDAFRLFRLGTLVAPTHAIADLHGLTVDAPSPAPTPDEPLSMFEAER